MHAAILGLIEHRLSMAALDPIQAEETLLSISNRDRSCPVAVTVQRRARTKGRRRYYVQVRVLIVQTIQDLNR